MSDDRLTPESMPELEEASSPVAPPPPPSPTLHTSCPSSLTSASYPPVDSYWDVESAPLLESGTYGKTSFSSNYYPENETWSCESNTTTCPTQPMTNTTTTTTTTTTPAPSSLHFGGTPAPPAKTTTTTPCTPLLNPTTNLWSTVPNLSGGSLFRDSYLPTSNQLPDSSRVGVSWGPPLSQQGRVNQHQEQNVLERIPSGLNPHVKEFTPQQSYNKE